MSRGIPQQCSKCGKAFMGSDAITLPIICPDCRRKEKLERMKKDLEEERNTPKMTLSSDIRPIDCGRKVGGKKCQECGNPVTESEGNICDECYSKYDAGMLSDLDA